MSTGVHIRGVVAYDKNDAGIVMLTVQIWPLPSSVVEQLNAHIQAQVNTYLSSHGIVNGQTTDLTTGRLPPN